LEVSTSALEEEAKRQREDAEAWALLALARRQEETRHQAKEECYLRLKKEAGLQAAAELQAAPDPRSA
jgi:hypothetical protein